jgi:hypothetical protein
VLYQKVNDRISGITAQSNTTCDEIFTTYLIEMARKLTPKMYKILIVFLLNFRNCLNEYGWYIIAQYKIVSEPSSGNAFCALNDAEHAPEVSNDFIMSYLPKRFPKFEIEMAIQMTKHLCSWLNKKGFTRAKIVANQEEDK